LLLAPAGVVAAQEAISTQDGPYVQPPAPIVRQPPESDSTQSPATQPDDTAMQPPPSNFDPTLFQRPIAKDQLAFLAQYDGADSGELYKDRQFRKLLPDFVPNCTFHYGSDKSLTEALDEVIGHSSEPVHVRDGRYIMLSGHMGPFLSGKGFLWIDMQTGIGLGGFYFHPTNGEPTPTVNIFSRQVQKEMLLEASELPPAFLQDFTAWTEFDRIPPLTTRYFITGSNKKILLEHDEDYCMPASGAGYDNCEQMNANASDMDLDAASYLEQTHHVTNATAWMITDPDLMIWIHTRDRTCGGVLDPLGCHVTMTRERTHIILHAPPPRPVAHPIHR
jgi:hypothetical protein